MQARKNTFTFLAVFSATITVILLAALFALAGFDQGANYDRVLLWGGIPTALFALLAVQADAAIKTERRHQEITGLLRAIGRELAKRG